MTNNIRKDSAQLEKRIHYRFKDKELLKKALTHSSYANEQEVGAVCNERLEFLGDSVLGLVSAEYYFNLFSDKPEGDLTKLRAAAVCEKALFGFADEIELGDYLFFGKGEEHTGGRKRPSILADAFEALIAAIYIDGGIGQAKNFILRFLRKIPHEVASSHDYKTMLQEVVQKNPGEHLEYKLISERGPDHEKLFYVNVRLNRNDIGKGRGKSKKLAEQAAAREALELMGII